MPNRYALKIDRPPGSGTATTAGWLGVSGDPPLTNERGGPNLSGKLPISPQTDDGQVSGNVNGALGPLISFQSNLNKVSGKLSSSLGPDGKPLNPRAPIGVGTLVVALILVRAVDPKIVPRATNPPTPRAARPVATHTNVGTLVVYAGARLRTAAWNVRRI